MLDNAVSILQTVIMLSDKQFNDDSGIHNI